MEKKEIELLASIARLNAIVAGMISENKTRERQGNSLAYDEAAFRAEIDNEGLGYNSVIEKLYH